MVVYEKSAIAAELSWVYRWCPTARKQQQQQQQSSSVSAVVQVSGCSGKDYLPKSLACSARLLRALLPESPRWHACPLGHPCLCSVSRGAAVWTERGGHGGSSLHTPSFYGWHRPRKDDWLINVTKATRSSPRSESTILERSFKAWPLETSVNMNWCFLHSWICIKGRTTNLIYSPPVPPLLFLAPALKNK